MEYYSSANQRKMAVLKPKIRQIGIIDLNDLTANVLGGKQCLSALAENSNNFASFAVSYSKERISYWIPKSHRKLLLCGAHLHRGQ
jgi:hypothetical protein